MRYKNTEYGTIPETWDICELGNLVQIKGRIGWKGYKTSDLRDSGPVVLGGVNIKNSPYLNLSDIKYLSREKYEESPEIKLNKNDVILVTRGNGIGDVSYFDGSIKEATINPSMVILSNFKGDSKYLYYYLVSQDGKNNILSIRSGSSIPAIYQNQLAKVKVPVPSISEQEKIVKVLSIIDDKIELNNKINENLQSMSQLLFKHWFVDFEFPNEEGLPYKPSGGEMVDSELGMIPKGWEVGNINSISDVVYGAPFSSKSFNNDGIGLPLIRIRDLKTFMPSFYTNEKLKNATIISPGNILVGMDAEFMPTIWMGESGYLNQRVCMFKSNKEYVHDYFIYELIKPYVNFFEHSKVGTTVIHLSKSDIDSIKIAIPQVDELKKFSEIIAPIYSKLIELSKENIDLTYIRDTILPKFMNGEIDVSNIEID